MSQSAYKSPQLIRESGEAYRARRNQYTTSHQLIEFRRCPLLYKQRTAGLVPELSGDFLTTGSAAHCLTLEGRAAFESQYIVGGPINPKTGRPYGDETKAFREWAAEQTKRVISDDAYALCCQIAASVRAHEEAARLLKRGTAEGVLRATYCDVECQVRLDWFDETAGLVDLKTTHNLDSFANLIRACDSEGLPISELAPDCDVVRYGYLMQMAFYRAIINLSAGLGPAADRWPVHLIAVEKQPPYRCGVFLINDWRLDVEEAGNSAALNRLRKCRSSGVWPTFFESVRIL